MIANEDSLDPILKPLKEEPIEEVAQPKAVQFKHNEYDVLAVFQDDGQCLLKILTTEKRLMRKDREVAEEYLVDTSTEGWLADIYSHALDLIAFPKVLN